MIQKNVADENEVKRAKSKEKLARDSELNDIRYLLQSQQGRRFLWRLMGFCGLHEDPSHQRGDMTHQNIGRGNVARFLLAEIVEANDEAYLQMMREAKQGEMKNV